MSGFSADQAIQVVDAFGEGWDGVVWLIVLGALLQSALQPSAQAFPFAAVVGKAVPVQDVISLHRFPALFALLRDVERDHEQPRTDPQCLPYMRYLEEQLDEVIGAILLVEEACEEGQEDVGLCCFCSNVRLIDDQVARDPVHLAFWVGEIVVRTGLSLIVVERRGRFQVGNG